MTPHNEAKKENIAKVVIMPGDPKRAKFITEHFLENYRLVNQVRGMLAYTGTYKGKEITVMASGMGIPSMGIYSYELFKFYDVDSIIRVGSMGAYTKDLNLFDIVLATESYSESNYAKIQNGNESNIIKSSEELATIVKDTANKMNITIHEGRVNSTEVFYSDIVNPIHYYEDLNCLGAEMETFALFHNANACGKKATAIITVSDNIITKEETTAKQRETAFIQMMELALESALNF